MATPKKAAKAASKPASETGRVTIRNWPYPKFKAAAQRTAKRMEVPVKALSESYLQKCYDDLWTVRATVLKVAPKLKVVASSKKAAPAKKAVAKKAAPKKSAAKKAAPAQHAAA